MQRRKENHQTKYSLSALVELIVSVLLTVIPGSPWSPLYPLSPLGPARTNKILLGLHIQPKSFMWGEKKCSDLPGWPGRPAGPMGPEDGNQHNR